MKLIKLWDADASSAYDLYQTFPADENGFMNEAYGLDRDGFTEFIEHARRNSLGQDLPEGYVPCTVYILVNDEGEYAGIFKLRHELNEALRNGAGHIGYGIGYQYRGRGCGQIGLSLALQEANKKGIETAYLSVNKNNPASLAVQLKNGAVIDHEDDQEYYTRIPTNGHNG